MALEWRSQLAQRHEVFSGKVPGRRQDGVQPWGPVALGQYEAIPRGVMRIRGVVPQHSSEVEDGHDLDHRQRRGRMSRAGLCSGSNDVCSHLPGDVLEPGSVLSARRRHRASFARESPSHNPITGEGPSIRLVSPSLHAARRMQLMADDMKSLSAPRGTYDLLPPQSWRWQALVRLAMDSFKRAGYAPIETPIFEHTEVFERGVGDTSDVVTKEMYTFRDRAGRSLTLRPELTAGIMRAVLQHGLARGPLPLKLVTAGPMFRQERPQKGRFRQFTQVNIEALGSEEPMVDAEVIEVGHRFLRDAGLRPTLLLNSIGHVDPSCRLGYHKVLIEFLEGNESSLAPVDRDRIHTNPLRTFDSKEERTVEVMRDAPLISDHICRDCRAHFEHVQG